MLWVIPIKFSEKWRLYCEGQKYGMNRLCEKLGNNSRSESSALFKIPVSLSAVLRLPFRWKAVWRRKPHF